MRSSLIKNEVFMEFWCNKCGDKFQDIFPSEYEGETFAIGYVCPKCGTIENTMYRKNLIYTSKKNAKEYGDILSIKFCASRIGGAYKFK